MMSGEFRIGMVAGEYSGDLLGAELLHGMRGLGTRFEALGIGGPCMREAGLRSLAPLERLAVMGVVEPLARLPGLLSLRARVRRRITAFRPDVFVGIDAPDFNLGLESRLRAAGFPVAHYVSPAVWAWRAGRIARLRRCTDLVLTLFPFEAQLLESQGVAARCVGHPLARSIALEPDRAAARAALGIDAGVRLLAVLPGSREAEIGRLAAPFLEACRLCLRQYPELRFVVPAASPARHAQLEKLLQGHPVTPRLTLLQGEAHTALAAADLVLVASGTATLEAMLMKRPMVVAYRMAALTHALVAPLLRTPWVALPNILAGERLVPELLQRDAQPQRIAQELLRLLGDEAGCERLRVRFVAMHRELLDAGKDTAAQAVLELAGRGCTGG